MYFTSGTQNQWKVKGTKNIKKKCSHCNNTSEHHIIGTLIGPALGFVFQPAKTKLGFKKYYLVCSICNKIDKEITRGELEYLKKEGKKNE